MENEWASTALFSLSMKIHNVGFFSTSSEPKSALKYVCMHDIFYSNGNCSSLYSSWFCHIDFSWHFVWVCREKKAININLNVRKLVDVLTGWSLELLEVIFHVSNYIWGRVVFECYFTCCFHFWGNGSHGNLLLRWLGEKLS